MHKIIVDVMMRIKPPIKISQHVIRNEFQPWLETILLIDDSEVKRLSDWSIGFFHCSHCHTYQGFAYKAPPPDGDPVLKEAHNDRNAFWREHAHGSGRIFLF